MLTATAFCRLPVESLISITIGLLGPALIVSVRLMSEIMLIRGTLLGAPISTTQAAVVANARHTTIQRALFFGMALTILVRRRLSRAGSVSPLCDFSRLPSALRCRRNYGERQLEQSVKHSDERE
jgi:hypothetical protein